MERIIVKLIGITLTLYITAIIIFKQNYNTYTYYIDILFFASFIFYFVIKKEKSLKMHSLIYAYSAFVILALIGSFYGDDFDRSASRSLQLFLILVNMFFMYNVFRKFQLYNSFLNGILLGAFINYLLILGILNVPFEIIMPGGGNRAMGTTGNPNTLAIIMIISILVSILYLNSKMNKYLMYYQYINIFLAIYTIIATVSKKGIIFSSMLILIFLSTTLKEPRKLFRLLSMVLITSLLLTYLVDMEGVFANIESITKRFMAFESQLSGGDIVSGSTGDRAYLIQAAWEVFKDYPLLGVGISNFQNFNRLGLYAHNNYMELLAGVGMVGTVIFYSIYYFSLKAIAKIKDLNLKIIFVFFIFILLIMDIAVVSYGSKYLLYILVFITAFSEDLIHKGEKKNE